jgi:hypothetical protein
LGIDLIALSDLFVGFHKEFNAHAKEKMSRFVDDPNTKSAAIEAMVCPGGPI